MKYWLHRISHFAELSCPLLGKGLLSIGWADCSTKDFYSNCKGNWEQFERLIEANYNSKPRSRWGLWRFLNEMMPGDLVLVPSWGTFSVYEILDDNILTCSELDLTDLNDSLDNRIILGQDGFLYKNDDSSPNNFIDLGFFRKVKPLITNVSRYEYADSDLTSRMKIRQTNSDISDLKDSITNAMEMYTAQRPINLESLIIENSQNLVHELIKQNLNDQKFEELIKWYFKNVGATDVFIPSKKSREEGDVDVIATFEKIKTIIFVQAKFHKGKTSSWAIEQISDFMASRAAMDDGYSKISWVVSNADKFTTKCYEKAKLANVLLINGPQFAKMLIEAGVLNINEAFKK